MASAGQGRATIKLLGDKNAMRIFKAMKVSVKEPALKRIFRVVGRILVNEEREQLDKKLGKYKSGATRRSIGILSVRKRDMPSGQIAGIGIGPIRRKNKRSSGYKAVWLEFGTPARYTKKGQYRGRVTAIGFVRAAVANKKRELSSVTGKKAQQKIEAEIKKHLFRG